MDEPADSLFRDGGTAGTAAAGLLIAPELREGGGSGATPAGFANTVRGDDCICGLGGIICPGGGLN